MAAAQDEAEDLGASSQMFMMDPTMSQFGSAESVFDREQRIFQQQQERLKAEHEAKAARERQLKLWAAAAERERVILLQQQPAALALGLDLVCKSFLIKI